MTEHRRVLFLCTGNSARSQMAEGLLRSLSDKFEVWSAGTHPVGLNPLAVEAMRELGIDISHHRSKALNEVPDSFDIVITVCDSANQECPIFPGQVERLHWSLPDPAQATGTEEERLQAFRRVRDELRRRIEEFLAAKLPHS